MISAALIQELRTSKEMIRALLAGITQEEARVKPAEYSWSMLEVVCHLYDEEREDFREHLGFILHRQQDEWHVIDPQNWVAERNYNGQNFTEMQEKFFAEREKSLSWLEELAGTDWESLYTSPFGSMRAGDMLAAWVAHDNLHLRQLVELRRMRIKKITEPF